MLRFIIIVLILSSLSRRRFFWGFPFLGGWGYGRHWMGGCHHHHRRPPMGWHRGWGDPFGF